MLRDHLPTKYVSHGKALGSYIHGASIAGLCSFCLPGGVNLALSRGSENLTAMGLLLGSNQVDVEHHGRRAS